MGEIDDNENYLNALNLAKIAKILPKNNKIYEIDRLSQNMINNIYPSQLKILKVTHELNEKIKSKQHNMSIYWDNDKNCYLCCNDSTYQLNTHNLSTTMLLVTNLTDSEIKDNKNMVYCDIVNQCSSLINVEKITPNPTSIKRVLMNNTLTMDKELSFEALGPFFNVKKLIEKCCISELELKNVLNDIGAFYHKPSDSWAILDLKFCANVLIDILQVMIRMNYQSKLCPIKEIYEFLFNYDRCIIDHVLIKLHATIKCNADNITNENIIIEVDDFKVSKTLFEYLLSKTSHSMLLDELIDIVKKCCPNDFIIHNNALKKIATITEHVDGIYVNYFPIEKLSNDPTKRIIEMFRFQELWSEDQLYDYMEDFIDHKLQIKRYTLTVIDPKTNKKLYKIKPGILMQTLF